MFFNWIKEEADINYRAALEISRAGELEIIVPSEVMPPQDLPKKLPSKVAPEVAARFDKLVRSFDNLRGRLHANSIDDRQGSEGRLLQIKIEYSLCGSGDDHGAKSAAASAGVVFRSSTSYLNTQHGAVIDVAKTVQQDPVACMYTLSGSPDSLRDLDGVRTWLPCIDAPNQRAIYDITLRVDAQYSVQCTGRKISSFVLKPTSAPASPRGRIAVAGRQTQPPFGLGTVPIASTRFFTVTRIPASSVGFFVGHAEIYYSPLYRTEV